MICTKKEYHSVAGVNKVNLETIGLISSLMFRFRRNDVFRRNEWDNYTNWRYKNTIDRIRYNYTYNLYVSVEDSNEFKKDILQQLGIVLDGHIREDT